MANGSKTRASRFGKRGVDPAQNEAGMLVFPFDKTITMSNVGGAVEFGSVALCGLPIGDLVVTAGILCLDVIETSANIQDTSTPSVALGTTATADNNLAAPSTDANLLPATALSAATGGVSPRTKLNLTGASVLASGGTTNYIDNNAGGGVFMNVTIPDAQISGAASIRVRGTLRIAYVGLGKNT